MVGVKGQHAWITGLTKETSEGVRKASETRKRLYAEGKIVPWNLGKTKHDTPQLSHSGVKAGNIPWNKGKRGLQKCPEWKKQYLRKLFRGRKISESQRKFLSDSRMGDKNPCWRGGISLLPYPSNWITLRKRIVKRDNFVCKMCGVGGKLDVHHIDYDKNNNNENNLICLCRNCHSATLTNRIYWRDFFNEINSNRPV